MFSQFDRSSAFVIQVKINEGYRSLIERALNIVGWCIVKINKVINTGQRKILKLGCKSMVASSNHDDGGQA